MGELNKNYWDNYYKTTKGLTVPSSFAIFCYDNFISTSKNKNVIDIGCGNFRDSNYFIENNCNVISLDYYNAKPTNDKIIYVMSDISKMPMIRINHYYLRWVLHSITKEDETALFNWLNQSSQQGSYLYIECRSDIDDNPYYKDEKEHLRRKINKEELLQKIKELNFEILHIEESKNLSKVSDDNNPILIRLVCKKMEEKKHKLLIKFPTRQRKDKFFQVLDMYYNFLSDSDNTYFIISCDTDDVTMNNKDVINKLQNYKNLQVFFGSSKTKIEAINSDMNKAGEWDILLLASDDMIPKIIGYDDIIRKEMKKNYPDTDGVLWFFDGIQKNLNTLSIMGRKYYNRFNYIYHPSYKSFYCDNEFQDVANILGKQTYLDYCIIKHEHYVWGFGKIDNLYHKNNIEGDPDKFVYERRKKVFFCIPDIDTLNKHINNEKKVIKATLTIEKKSEEKSKEAVTVEQTKQNTLDPPANANVIQSTPRVNPRHPSRLKLSRPVKLFNS